MLKHKLFDQKDKFEEIFNASELWGASDASCEEIIEAHLEAWVRSRIYGISASMAFYGEETEAITLIDEIARNNF